MPVNPAILRHPSLFEKCLGRRRSAVIGSPEASSEVYAYAAARDLALAVAERESSHLTLNRAFLANQMVEMCLKSMRSPYQAQALPEAEALRERRRCEVVRDRISQLRSGSGSQNFPTSVAA